MKIKIICLGKSKQKFIEDGIKEYQKRISKYAKIELNILPDIALTKTNTIEIVKNKEAEILEKHLIKDDFIIVLDEKGKQFTSLEFSKYISKINKNIIFMVGGVYGISEKILKKTNLILSFSNFTFTHQMIRLILMEQLYRAFSISEGKKYHY
ncbi:MAG TPA: 23S rRNA (pseudouridine(1915)-N(3))-methyltransferase RlmH [Candidatus Cloacimonetes bacterium]|nr:23S rRNA (pseudouridine(1915)-N(3))-methyltransferase RlmH [Candidatus Cloacimonadota bacterium]